MLCLTTKKVTESCVCFPVFLFGVYMFIIFKQDLNFRSQSKSNVVENVNSLSLLIYVSLDIEYICVCVYSM